MPEKCRAEHRKDEQQDIFQIESEKAPVGLEHVYSCGNSGHQQGVNRQAQYPRYFVPIGRYQRNNAEADRQSTEADQRPQTQWTRPLGFIVADALCSPSVNQAGFEPNIQFPVRQSPIPVQMERLRETIPGGK